MHEPGFVGRARELANLDRRFTAARAGHGGLVLVEGEAGAGKTALAQAFVDRVRSTGVRTAWGSCLEGEGAPAYQPWVRILRAVGGPASLLLDPGASGTRPHLFDEVVDALRTAASGTGLLMVVDDLHWADVPSMRLLQALASVVGDARLLVIALYRGRDVPPRADLTLVLEAMRRERATFWLTLPGLSSAEVGELTARAHGGRLDDRTVHAVQERAEGNPLFALELARLTATAGLDTGLPDTVRAVIGRRLDALPPGGRQLLRQAAVLGREFTLDLLAALADVVPEAALDHLDAAVAGGLVTAGGAGAFRFAHVLIRDVLYAETSSTVRQRSHARAADALGAGGKGVPLDALAHHLREAAPLGRADEALRATRLAATRARDQLAYEHAAFQYRAALALVPLVRAGDAPHAELLLELARCEFRAGAVEDAWRACREAAALGRAMRDGAVVADAATVLRGTTGSPVTGEIHALSREGLTVLAGTDPVREAKLLAQLAITADRLTTGADPDWSLRALRTADETGDADALFLAMQARYTDLVHPQHVNDRMSLGERAIALGQETGNDEYTAWGHVWRIDAQWELGRRVALEADLTAFAGLVKQLGEPLWRWRLGMMRAVLALFEGRFADAAALADQARTIGVRGGHAGADSFHLIFRAHLAALGGTGLDAVEADVRRAVADMPYFARLWHADVLAGMGRLEEAAQLWNTAAPHVVAFPREAPEWIILGVGATKVCVALGDRQTAATVYGALLAYADRQVISGAHTPCYGPVSLYLGMLAGLLGREPEAKIHLEAALAAARETGSGPYEAIAHLELARLLSRRRPHPQAADPHLDAALRLARRLDMGPLTAAAMALRAAALTARDLTPREKQVAALIAEGLSNRQIAQRLRLSERTAENHVTHILTKLGFDSRARIASWYTAGQRGD